jgi:hypothetical protein
MLPQRGQFGRPRYSVVIAPVDRARQAYWTIIVILRDASL